MRARFEIVTQGVESMTIRDIGHKEGLITVTNDAEAVVDYMRFYCGLKIGMRLFYFDSSNQLDEIVLDSNGKFSGFAPGKNASARGVKK